MAEKILTKAAIRRLRFLAIEPEKDDKLKALDMAEKYRQYIRHKQRDKRRKRSPRSGCSTGYLTLEQFARVMECFDGELNSRRRLTRAIIIILAESGLRASELSALKIKDLPCWHGHSSIEVKGKGGFERTVVISKFLVKFIEKLAGQDRTKTDYFLLDEGGKKLLYPSIYQRLRRAFAGAGLPWAHPHTLRHTFTTHLKEAGADFFFIKRQLGHRFKDTTGIYAHDSEEISRNQMQRFHERLWSRQKEGFLPYTGNNRSGNTGN